MGCSFSKFMHFFCFMSYRGGDKIKSLMDTNSDEFRSGREGCGGSFPPPPFRGQVINEEKCKCAVPEVQLLGQHTTTWRISPLQERSVATQNHPKPATVR
jgi:hypothetical protein